MIWIELDRDSDISIIQQLYLEIRKQILNGRLKAEERLPSSRELAETLNISRNVVIEVYEQLLAEGFLKSKQGAGTFVASGALLEGFPVIHEHPITSTPRSHNSKEKIDFRSGIPALDMFPRKKWLLVAKEVYEDIDASFLGYSSPEGNEELRSTLSNYLFKMRGISCTPDQIVITSGATQAFTILARLLLKQGSEIMMEDPVTKEIPEIFSVTGARIHPIPVDEFGIKTELLPIDKSPIFTFVTPSHQYPLGGTLPIQRRIQLINYAAKTSSYIVEDDYDSEFRYTGSPISSLQGLAPEKVIYIGTFSKILSPSLRIGYLILPSALIQKVRNLKRYTDYHSPTIDQIILARFIQQGYLDKHITKMRKLYKTRRDILIKSLVEQFKDKVKITGSSTGLHLIAQFSGIEFSDCIVEKLKNEYDVIVYPVERHAIVKGSHNDKLIFGYGNHSIATIREGIERLKEGLDTIDIKR